MLCGSISGSAILLVRPNHKNKNPKQNFGFLFFVKIIYDEPIMQFSRRKNFLVVLLAISPFIFITSFFAAKNQDVLQKVSSKHFVYESVLLSDAIESIDPADLPKPLANPSSVIQAVYATGWSAGNKNYLNYLSQLFKTTQINAVVIDIKDYSGIVSYKSGAPKVREYKTYQAQIPNIDALVRSLHDQGIYVIGRVAVFEDPALAQVRPDLAVYDTSETQDLLHPVLWQDNNHL